MPVHFGEVGRKLRPSTIQGTQDGWRVRLGVVRQAWAYARAYVSHMQFREMTRASAVGEMRGLCVLRGDALGLLLASVD